MTLHHLSDAMHNLFTEMSGHESTTREARGKQGFEAHGAVVRFRARWPMLGLSDVQGAKLLAQAHDDIRRASAVCESPIERNILPWLVLQDYGTLLDGVARVHVPKDEPQMPVCPVVVVPQFAFVRFRLDFALVARAHDCMRIFAIECDGGSYHDAARDKQRDAYMNSWGVETIRLDGRAIYRDGRGEAEKVAQRLMAWEDGLRGRRNGELS